MYFQCCCARDADQSYCFFFCLVNKFDGIGRGIDYDYGGTFGTCRVKLNVSMFR